MRPLLATIPGGEIRVHTPSPFLISRATSVHSKETDTIDWIDGFVRVSVFWDVGANLGKHQAVILAVGLKAIEFTISQT